MNDEDTTDTTAPEDLDVESEDDLLAPDLDHHGERQREIEESQVMAKQFYADRYHVQLTPLLHNYWLYGYVGALGVKSAFEFGCNAGRHLFMLKQQGIDHVDGVDISHRAIEAARLCHKLSLREGDEATLKQIPTGAFDLVFTVSALSHMPEISYALKQLQRIARKHIVFVETRTLSGADYWWRHDYPGECVYSYHAKQVNAVYQVWHVEK